MVDKQAGRKESDSVPKVSRFLMKQCLTGLMRQVIIFVTFLFVLQFRLATSKQYPRCQQSN